MVRTLLLCLALFAAAWLEFKVYPGHSYLEGETQLYAPVLERQAAPGLLSRDLVATSGELSLTAYDEATLLLHQAGRQPLGRALADQQFTFRIAALLGFYLLLRASGLSQLFSFVVAALAGLGATVAGPAVMLTNREPVPGAFAFCLILLAMGLMTDEKPLLAGLMGGLALLYDPVLAAPFWIVALAGFALNGTLRRVVRPMLPILLIFALLLANLAQLQPETAGDPLATRISSSLVLFQKAHAPQIYVSAWAHGEIWQILALCVLALWAAARCWPILNEYFRWMVLGCGLCGLLAIPISYGLIDEGHFLWAARFQPARTLIYSAAGAAVLFGLAGMRAMLERRIGEAAGWFFLLILLPASRGLFDSLRLFDKVHLARFGLVVALAAMFTGLVWMLGRTRWRFALAAVPLVAAFAFWATPGLRPAPVPFQKSLAGLAIWADTSTWGSSVFLFADAGRAAYPDVFRAESRRGLWVDWNSAPGVLFADKAAMAWQERWENALAYGFSTQNLERMLARPVDYYVLRKRDELSGVRSVFSNRDFLVYDAEDLRNATKPLRLERGM